MIAIANPTIHVWNLLWVCYKRDLVILTDFCRTEIGYLAKSLGKNTESDLVILTKFRCSEI